MYKSLLSILLLTTGVTCAAAQASKSANPPAPIIKGEIGAKIDELLTRYAGYGFSGTALIAIKGEIVLHKAYGLANIESSTANTLDTIFDIGSLTKTFTAAAILQLEKQGKLSLNDSIGKHLEGV